MQETIQRIKQEIEELSRIQYTVSDRLNKLDSVFETKEQQVEKKEKQDTTIGLSVSLRDKIHGYAIFAAERLHKNVMALSNTELLNVVCDLADERLNQIKMEKTKELGKKLQE